MKFTTSYSAPAVTKVCAAVALFAAAFGTHAGAPLNLSAYPKLDQNQLGHVNRIVALAHQKDGDWAGMGSFEPGQQGFDALRYQLAFMSYALAATQYKFTPAYRELYEETDRRLIAKMTRHDVWGYWEQSSRGNLFTNPGMKEPAQGWIDPIVDQNIMYSGHLLQMVATHQVLYGDDRYARPGGLTLKYNVAPMGKLEFPYDTHSLAKAVAKQFDENAWKSVACEPNGVYTECNQHPLLGFEMYDRLYGTKYFPKFSSALLKHFKELNYIDPKTSSFMGFYQVKQNYVVRNPEAWNDGWSGAFMHAWNKREVEEVYPAQRTRFIVQLPDGTATTKLDKPDPDALFNGYNFDHGFFMFYASEVGDTDTANRMLAYADKYWSPKWIGDQLVYERNDQFKRPGDAPNVWRRVGPVTANALIGLTRLSGKDGMFNLFSKPLPKDRFSEPFIARVDHPSVQVSRAIYDGQAKALVVTMKPGANGSRQGNTTWMIKNLDAAKTYAVWADGNKVATLTQGVARSEAKSGVSLAKVEGGFEVSSTLDKERTFVVSEE